MKEEKTLKWKLSEKPTAENLRSLVEIGIMTKEEAKKIVLDESSISQSDIEEIKAEMSLLRKMILELSEKSGKSIEIVRIIEREIPVYKDYYWHRPWWRDNIVWCSNQLASYNNTTSYTTSGSAYNALSATPTSSLSMTAGVSAKNLAVQALSSNEVKSNSKDFPNIKDAISKLNIK